MDTSADKIELFAQEMGNTFLYSLSSHIAKYHPCRSEQVIVLS